MQITFPHLLLSQLSELLAMKMGLYYPEKRWGDLERGITCRRTGAWREGHGNRYPPTPFQFPDAQTDRNTCLPPDCRRDLFLPGEEKS